jgi:hypothetical protein
MAKERSRKGSGATDVERSGDNVSPVTTVVGGQTRRAAHGTTRVPIGIEKVLYLAASNDAFRKALLDDRAGTLARSGVRLTDVERATLLGVPGAALETMIGRISPARHGKRSFMKTVAAATVSLAAGVAAAGCKEEEGPEPNPDVAEAHDEATDATEATETADAVDTADVEPPDGTRGITPDVPEDVEDVVPPPDYAAGGVMPDVDIDSGWEPEAK